MQYKDLLLRDIHSKRISIGIWIFFCVFISIFSLHFHELWKDEWQSWFVAKDMSVGQIFNFLYYEGHGGLWYYYLKLWTFFEDTNVADTFLISMAHLIIVYATLYLLIVRFEVPFLLKLLIISSYFLGFEYCVINRGYILVAVLYFYIIDRIKHYEGDGWHLGISLFFLCQTEVYGVIMSVILLLYIHRISPDGVLSFKSNIFKYTFAGILFFILSVYPRYDGHISRTQGLKGGIFEQWAMAFQGNLSNTFFIGSISDTVQSGPSTVGIILSLVALVLLFFLFFNEVSLYILMVVYLFSAIMFSTFFFLGGVRHWGMGFIFLIGLIHLRQNHTNLSLFMAIGLMIFPSWHGIKAWYLDYSLPFTNAKEAGYYIKEKVPDKVPIVALNKFDATPVVGYSGKSFFSLPDGNSFTYFRWVDKVYVPSEPELQLFGKYKSVGGIVVISGSPIDPKIYPSLTFWKAFEGPNFKNENFYLYTLVSK